MNNDSMNVYERFFKVLPTLFCTAGFDGRFTELNPAWETMSGFSAAEMTGKLCLDFIHPDDQGLVEENQRNLLAGKEQALFETRFRCRDGTYRWLLMRCAADQETKLFYAAATDITARKSTEDSLRESENTLRKILDRAPLSMSIVGMDGTIEYINQKAGETFGYAHADIPTMDRWWALAYPDEKYRKEVEARWMTRVREAFAEQREIDGGQYLVTCRDGSIKTCFIFGVIAAGKVFVMFDDISRRVEAEKALRESEEKYRTLVDHAPIGIIVHDQGAIRFVNNKIAELCHMPDPASLVGHNTREFVHPEDRELVEKRMQLFKSQGLPLPPAEEGILAADGSVHELEIQSIPIVARGENCTMTIAHDITARKKAERELLEANAELERRVKDRTSQLEELNKELEAFSYSAAHDMKAPLRRVNIFAEMLEKEADPALKEGPRSYVRNIRKSVTHMTMLVEGLLTLSTTGRKPLQLEPVGLSALLAEAIAEVKAENAGRPIEWTAGKMPEVQCDRAMLKQVFLNLVGNAVKYTRGKAPARIEIFHSRENGEHIIGVRDNGVGFNMEHLDRLFGVFQRLHKAEEFEGTGIGLSTVRRIVSRHGGRAWAESASGAGATFFFSLPAR